METVSALLMVLSGLAGLLLFPVIGVVSCYQLFISRKWSFGSYLKIWAIPFVLLGLSVFTMLVRSALTVGVDDPLIGLFSEKKVLKDGQVVESQRTEHNLGLSYEKDKK